jgi:hypothetical protein
VNCPAPTTRRSTRSPRFTGIVSVAGKLLPLRVKKFGSMPSISIGGRVSLRATSTFHSLIITVRSTS